MVWFRSGCAAWSSTATKSSVRSTGPPDARATASIHCAYAVTNWRTSVSSTGVSGSHPVSRRGGASAVAVAGASPPSALSTSGASLIVVTGVRRTAVVARAEGVEVGDDPVDIRLRARDARAAELDQLTRALHAIGEDVDVEVVAFELVED